MEQKQITEATRVFNSELGPQVSLSNGQRLQVFGDTLARMPQHKELDINNIKNILPSLNQDQIRLLGFESRLQKLKAKQRRQERRQELLDWATQEFGIDDNSNPPTYAPNSTH